MESGPLLTNLTDSTAIVTFNRPESRNSLSKQILFELDKLLANLISNRKLKTLIFTGVGDVFLSGANIPELKSLDFETAREFSRVGQKVIRRLTDAPQLTIAAINGYCMGGGLDFALACDIRLSSSSAVFAHPGAKLGIITGWGGTQRLPRLVGKARAIEFFVTARRIQSSEALKIGLITAISDPVMERAMVLANNT